jgi:DNA-binding SARP family transcriptional activator
MSTCSTGGRECSPPPAATPTAWKSVGLVLRQDPCREDVHRLIMRCQARFGRTSEALRQYERCRRALRETLGLEPSAPTQALARALREGRQRLPTAQLSYS